MPKIGVIGGSGLYSMPGFTEHNEVAMETPFGKPSDNYIVGKLEGKEVAFLARHGRGHRISPSELNFRANIYGMKSLGVERIVSGKRDINRGSLPADQGFDGLDELMGLVGFGEKLVRPGR